jgi:hypothetical protein
MAANQCIFRVCKGNKQQIEYQSAEKLFGFAKVPVCNRNIDREIISMAAGEPVSIDLFGACSNDGVLILRKVSRTTLSIARGIL